MPEGPSEFAASSNGDKWFLDCDEAAGEYIVIHRANVSSGGAETRWPTSTFLRLFGDHPQGDALRKTMRVIGSAVETATERTSIEPKPMGLFPWSRRSDRAED